MVKGCKHEDFPVWISPTGRRCGGCGYALVEAEAGELDCTKDIPATVGWQPIASAPKTGMKIQLALLDGSVTAGWYGPKYSRYGAKYGDDWGYGTQWCDVFRSPPTHWMPLPPPPTETASAEREDPAPIVTDTLSDPKEKP